VYSLYESVRSIDAPKINWRVPTDRMLLRKDFVDTKPWTAERSTGGIVFGGSGYSRDCPYTPFRTHLM
jgi:hypothetical protein